MEYTVHASILHKSTYLLPSAIETWAKTVSTIRCLIAGASHTSYLDTR